MEVGAECDAGHGRRLRLNGGWGQGNGIANNDKAQNSKKAKLESEPGRAWLEGFTLNSHAAEGARCRWEWAWQGRRNSKIEASDGGRGCGETQETDTPDCVIITLFLLSDRP